MTHLDSRAYEVGKKLLTFKSQDGISMLSPDKWSQMLFEKMMANENFRVAALRFTDVAPTLKDDSDLMIHLSTYFGNVGGFEGLIGRKIPTNKLVGKMVAPIVRHNIRTMARTFIAGETIDHGIEHFEKLHKQGLACSIDLLGEAVINSTEAQGYTDAYHEAVEKIADAAKDWPETGFPEKDSIGPIARANVSVKLTALYEHVDPKAHDHCVEVLSKRLLKIVRKAKEHNAYVHVDVEHYHLLPLTTAVFKNVLMHEDVRDYPHVGIVLQAYLKDTEKNFDDLLAFAKERGTPFTIRLVKGAYWDFEQAFAEQMGWPCPVYSEKAESDVCFEKITRKLLEAFPTVRPAIGSHNARSLGVAVATAEELGMDKRDIEFQVLHGMAEPYRDGLKEMGFRVRQYCPVGEFIPGMSYLVRRLLENTANQSFIAQNAQEEGVSADTLLAPPEVKGDVKEHEYSFENMPEKDYSQADVRKRLTETTYNFRKKLPLTVRPMIGGKKVKGKGKKISLTCPWVTDLTVSHVELADQKQADEALKAAKKAQESWHMMGFEKRAGLLERAADLMEERWNELFAIQVFEASKDWAHADADIAEAIDFLRYYAQQARELEGNFQPQSVWGEENRIYYKPKGVALVIAPWNFPLAISTGMTAAALVTGNTVLYKPAEQTCANGQFMAEIFQEAGFPRDVFHFLPAKGSEVGSYLVAHPDVSLIAFTGSRQVGLNILETAGKVQDGQRDVKKCVIEMGGKNAIIVDSDADLDEAVPGVVHSAFGFQGQKCSACSRAIVVGSAYDNFVERLSQMVKDMRVGTPLDPTSDVTAVIDSAAKEKIESYIQIGHEDGALLAQAPKPDIVGHFVPPTVFTDLKEDSRLTYEEVFGPVLAIYRAKNIEEALAMATDSDYALTGGLFSRNPKNIDYIRANYRVGNLYINRGNTGALVSRQPFGGGAMSGTGTKAGGPDYLLHFVEPRTITENTMRRGFAPKENE